MSRYLLTLLFVIFYLARVSAQGIVVPNFNDTYSKYVKQLETGDTNIDYKAFRESFIESKQWKLANKQRSKFDSLEKAMYEAMDTSDYDGVIRVTQAMLSIDYTSMIAHKILYQTYRIKKDKANQAKYRAIEFGLLLSIMHTGDGRTCETAWHVIQLSEEYFILNMRGAHLKQQSLVTSDGLCDKMETILDEGEGEKTYYFEVSKVFEGRKKF